MAKISDEQLDYIIDAWSRGFNPFVFTAIVHPDALGTLAHDLKQARALLRDSKREHMFMLDKIRGLGRAAVVGCTKQLYPDDECTCGADAWNARVDAVLSGDDK